MQLCSERRSGAVCWVVFFFFNVAYLKKEKPHTHTHTPVEKENINYLGKTAINHGGNPRGSSDEASFGAF